jgi:hypothetical protein
MWQVFSTALCSTRRRRGRHRWDALRPDKHPAVMARRSGQGMKPLAARACARPLTAPSTMTLLEQPNRARCTINCRIHRSLMERARSRSSAGYRPATLSLDSLVGSLAARPIASLGPYRGGRRKSGLQRTRWWAGGVRPGRLEDVCCGKNCSAFTGGFLFKPSDWQKISVSSVKRLIV